MNKMKYKRFNKFLKFILFKGVIGVSLWPFGIYYKSKLTNRLKNHEGIHWCQQREMAGIFFYLWYFIEWILRLIPFGLKAYRNISFEREAKTHELDLEYTHPFYGWVKYIFTKTKE